MHFNVKVYAVLEYGKKSNLSIAKFSQERGAASSFHRVVNTIESVFKESHFAIVDSTKKKGILKTMRKAGL